MGIIHNSEGVIYFGELYKTIRITITSSECMIINQNNKNEIHITQQRERSILLAAVPLYRAFMTFRRDIDMMLLILMRWNDVVCRILLIWIIGKIFMIIIFS